MPMILDVDRTFFSRSERVKSVDFHPTEPWLVVGLYNGHVSMWNYVTNTLIKDFEVAAVPVRCVRFVARKNWIITGSDDFKLRCFNINTQEKVTAFEAHPDYIRAIAVHPTASYVLTGSDDMSIKMWDWEKSWKCVQTFEGHTHYIMNLTFNPKDSNTFASACLDRTVKVWSLGSSHANFTMEAHDKGVNYVEYYQGNDKPYLLTTGDDRLVKIWDYHSKTLIQTLESHTSNVSFAMFHPTLPIIISGGEDGTIKIWHSGTYRLENTLNYSLERAWCIASRKGGNEIAVGFDEGVVVIKLGRDEPTFSMDSTGKLVYAKNTEILTANLQSLDLSDITEGAKIPISLRELGTTEIYAQSLIHSPNGRFVTAIGDGEYIIFTSLAWRNKAFGAATSFAWSTDSNVYAVREAANGKVRIYKNFRERVGLINAPGHSGVNSVHGGNLLAGIGKGFVCFWDWETGAIVRRIDVDAKQISWSETGSLVAIIASDSFFVLQFNQDAYTNHLNSGANIGDEGVESAFEVIVEISESVQTSRWVSECFVYTNSNAKLNYLIGESTHTVHNFDTNMYLLGYLPQHERVYVVNKDLSIFSYSLSLSFIQYQSAILSGDMEEASNILPNIPKDQKTKVARFLEAQGQKELALSISTDPEQRFELAMSVGNLNAALEIVQQQPSEQKWKIIGDQALSNWDLTLAQQCFEYAQDLPALLLLYTSIGDIIKLKELAQNADKKEQHNVAFAAWLQAGQTKECVNLLIRTGRASEAAMFARTYAPSMIPVAVSSWKTQLDSKGKSKLAATIACSTEQKDLFEEDITAALSSENDANSNSIKEILSSESHIWSSKDDTPSVQTIESLEPDVKVSADPESISTNKKKGSKKNSKI